MSDEENSVEYKLIDQLTDLPIKIKRRLKKVRDAKTVYRSASHLVSQSAS